MFKPKKIALLDVKNYFRENKSDLTVIKLKPMSNRDYEEDVQNVNLDCQLLTTFEGSPGESESPSPTYKPIYRTEWSKHL